MNISVQPLSQELDAHSDTPAVQCTAGWSAASRGQSPRVHVCLRNSGAIGGRQCTHAHTGTESPTAWHTTHLFLSLQTNTYAKDRKGEVLRARLKPSNMHADKQLVRELIPPSENVFLLFFYLLHEILAIQHPSRPEEWSTMTQNIDRSVRAAQHVNFWLEQHQCVPVVFWLSSLSPSWCFAGSLSWYSMLHVRN